MQLWLDGADGDLVDRLDEFIRDRLAADPGIRVHFASELSQLRWRALLDDPYLRRLLRGRLDALEDLVAGKLEEELGFPRPGSRAARDRRRDQRPVSDDAGARGRRPGRLRPGP